MATSDTKPGDYLIFALQKPFGFDARCYQHGAQRRCETELSEAAMFNERSRRGGFASSGKPGEAYKCACH